MQKKTLLKILLVLIIITIFIPKTCAHVTWTPIQIIKEISISSADMPTLSETPSIAAWEKNIHIVWTYWPNEEKSQIYYKKSTDNGKTWDQETLLINQNDIIVISPQIAVSNKNIHIIWKDFRHGNPEIYYIKSTDNGKNWNEPIRVTYNSSRKSNIFESQIIAKNDQIFICWKDYRTGSSEVFFKKSTDNGITWSDDIRVTRDFSASYNPNMYIDSKYIYLVWEDGARNAQICFSQSSTFGDSWSPKRYLTTHSGKSNRPTILAHNNSLYVFWQDDRDKDTTIYYKTSIDKGKSWTNATPITNIAYNSVNPHAIAYNAKIFLFWLDTRDGNYEIYYKTANTANLDKWTNETRITNDSIDSHDLTIANCGNNIHLAWQNFYSGDGGEIAFTNTLSQDPIILNLDVSHNKINSINPTVLVTVNGMDNQYNKSNLSAIIQYRRIDKNKWITCHPNLNQNLWQTTINFSGSMQPGLYEIRAKIVHPAGNESNWLYSTPLHFAPETNRKSTDFTVSIVLLSIFVIIIILRRRNTNE